MNQRQRKVLMVAYCFPPVAAVGAYRMIRFVRYLPDSGWQPLVLTVDTKHVRSTDVSAIDPIIDFPIDRGLLDYVPKDVFVERRSIVRPVRTSIVTAKRISRQFTGESAASSDPSFPQGVSNVPPGPLGMLRRFVKSGIDRAFLALAFPDLQSGWFLPALSGALSIVRKERPSAIVSSGPPHTSHLVATVLKQLTGLPLVLDFRDPWARSPWNQTRGSRLRNALNGRLERWCVNQADCVMLNTADLHEEFVSAYPTLSPDKFTVLPNGYDPELVVRVAALRRENAPAPRKQCVRICHPGSIYGPRDLRPVISAIARPSRSDCPIILDQVGLVADPASILQYAAQLGVQDRIVLHGQVSHGDALRQMARADLFVLCQPGTSLQVPAKLFEMLSFRRPILALAEPAGATAQIIERYELGLVVRPDDHEAVSQGLVELIDQGEQLIFGEGWRQAMREFNGRDLTGKLGSILDKLVVQKAHREHSYREEVQPGLVGEQISADC